MASTNSPGSYQRIKEQLDRAPARWLVTGAAGFIGSHLVEHLLLLNQSVAGMDNFATGYQHNLDDVAGRVGPQRWRAFEFLRGDVADIEACRRAVAGADYVLHQAALGSVPRSLEDPLSSNRANVDGFLNMLLAARDAGVKRFVYASSSSVYGDHPALPKREEDIGNPLSPYAVTKRVDEIYARNFAEVYGQAVRGLRYFNVFGPRQDPHGAYAAVIPRWIAAVLAKERCVIYGDGETSRDFCYVDNVVQANILAAAVEGGAGHEVFNIAAGGRTTLNDLHRLICRIASAEAGEDRTAGPIYEEFRRGDVRHSLASIEKAHVMLGYEAAISVEQGLQQTIKWFNRSGPN